ncbi:LIM homeobox transcription factor 1-alpha-like protein [Leptotrombidium deliense]|uniref:LIM homeobox transcription factor 1-alpha-like protein n=1 Tax=Leptotrombidium deliense TaxID=299467 RepID=A0A443SJY8_9ACAR|nr:LIM homeobox transcription factor 1-alpha-like protein [Leptotrombidium deliense]
MRALDYIYHLSCFCCVACGRQLKKGDQFVIRSGRLFCRPDFEKEMAIMHLSSQTSENAVVPNNSQNSPIPSSNNSNGNNVQRQDGRRGPKRPRTILTTAQRRAFKASFEISQKPCRKVRESLAKETGLSVRIVQVWFQNQRAKLKKIQRKQQQLQQQHQQQSGSGADCGGQSGDKSSVDKMSPYSRLAHSSGHLSDSSVDSPGFSVPQMQYLTHSPDGSYYSTHEDGYSKGELGMESETSLGGLEDVLINHQSASNGGEESNVHQSAEGGHTASLFGTTMTPIDKLYSMQTSYFSSNQCECLGAPN